MDDKTRYEADGDLLRNQVRAALGMLTPLERQVVELRFGIVDGRSETLEEAGRRLGLTRERVRRIEAEALQKLRDNRSCRDSAVEFQVILTREGEKWTAEVPALPGCITWGRSRDEVLALAKEAIEGWLASGEAGPEDAPQDQPAIELASVRVG